MLRLEHDKKDYTIYTLFEEVSIRKLHKGYEYLQKAPIGILSYLKDSTKEVEPTKLLDFQIKWIALFSEVPLEVLKMISPKGREGQLSIEAVYELVKKFAYTPENYYDLFHIELDSKVDESDLEIGVRQIDFKKERFELVKDLITISGAKMFFSEGTYNQFKLANMLASQLDKSKSPATAECLVQLCAVLYTQNEDNSDEEIARKIKLFWDLDSATAWSCYFFLSQLQNRWKDFFLSYTGKTTRLKEHKAKRMMAKEQLRNVFRKTIIGKLWSWKSANYKPLIMDWKV